MASLSLPRVLQLKKNSLDAEREHFEKFQTLAIQKAINAVETPVKEKHVRSTIIGTFQEQSAITYWMVALRLPLQDNRIVAWKFCNVTHKVLREGHPASLDDSQRHVAMVENLGKLWVHLREGYGRLVNLYCNLLVTKLKFHARNPQFPGNMLLTADELDAIAENDVNNYFQICVELFDYMDDILTLQAAVFDSLGNARANSMTASGQCRLAALIPCAQDSSHIYDCNVRLLFRLHAALPADTLAGHRERFRQQFKKLSQFYKHASSLQYYRNLLTLPVLPANPPNFLLQSDFGTYVAPVVSIPEPAPDEVDTVGSLIDTSDTYSQVSNYSTTPDHVDMVDSRATPSPQPDPLVERDRLIDHLQNELRRMRGEVSQLVQERNTMIGSMREHCTRIETQLHETKTDLEEERQKAEILSAETPEIKQKLTETEEKARVTDDKFQKLKGAYTQLREEHIALIRQKAEVDKMSASLRAATAQHESAKLALQQQLNDRTKDVELLQQSASSSEEIEAYKEELSYLRTELEQSRLKELELETLRASMEALQIEHKTAATEQEEKITTIESQLTEVTESLEKIKEEKEERENELNKAKEELVNLRENSGNEYKRVLEEKEDALRQVAELTEQHQQEKEEQIVYINNMQAELETEQQKLSHAETTFASICQKFDQDMGAKNKALEITLMQKDTEIREAQEKVVALETQVETIRKTHEESLSEKDSEITSLQNILVELAQNDDINRTYIEDIEHDRDRIRTQVNEVTNEKISLQETINEKDEVISKLTNNIRELLDIETRQNTALVQIESTKNKEIDQLNAVVDEKEKDIISLKNRLVEELELVHKHKTESESFLKTIAELESAIEDKSKNLDELNFKLTETTSIIEKQKIGFETLQKESEKEITVLKETLQTVTDLKDDNIKSLKDSIAEKDEKVISLNIEVNQLTVELTGIKEVLNESQAELEIGRNEFLTLREEHEDIVQRNENNLVLKNQELRSLNDEVNNLSREKTELITEKEKLCHEFSLEKQVFENKIRELQDLHETTTTDIETIKTEKEESITKLNNEIIELKSHHEQLKDSNGKEIKSLCDKIEQQTTLFNNNVCEKDAHIEQVEKHSEELKVQLNEIQELRGKDKTEMDEIVAKKEQEMQILETRLQHTEGERLTAECELQDLLQHNSELETDLVAMKKQLAEAQRELEKERTRLVSCAGEAALAVTNDALAALERANARDTNQAAAETAAQALDQLARQAEVKGNEESVSRLALSAAHNTAALAAYATEIGATDMELADKLNQECRTMLTATKHCLESLQSGLVQSASCVEARGHLRLVAQKAAAADSARGGARSVDDELADMDSAIAQAAAQIESMLAASKAGDSGVKLEVNGKILDACTTLMGAVKILVQDARTLQNELGDPIARQRMYRRNPQWSEGLISAAKAVVFAAKLLVSSADDAVGADGRVEGVSAAAHEVAGSTAQLVAASRARAPPAAPALARLTHASRAVASATGAVVAAVRAASALHHEQEALDTSSLTLTATRRLEMESKVRSLELESALEAERVRLAALRKRHYHLAQQQENGGLTNGNE